MVALSTTRPERKVFMFQARSNKRDPDQAPARHPVDTLLPPGKLLILAIQHVLTMYSGAVTVPIIIGSALHLPADQTAYLISSDLLACGLITILQCMGVFGIGVRLPIVMGVSFVAIGPSIAIASNPGLGIPGIFGATLASGLAGLLIAPVFSRLSRVFAPVVTGSAMLLIGLSLFGPAIGWAAGGKTDGAGDLPSIAIATFVLLTILAIIRFGRGFLGNMAVLIGILTGYAVTIALGWVDFSPIESANWLAVVQPLHFGLPRFDPLAALSMTVVMLITMVESSGMMFALSRIVDKPLTLKDLTRGLRADAAGALIGGFFNSLPYTSYSQNIAMVSMTGVYSRFVCALAGVILIVLGSIPKLSFIVTSIPLPVLGGAALVMFGMVAANGVQSLGRADVSGNRKNLYIIAASLGIGLIPTLAPKFFDNAPKDLAAFLHNGVMLGIFTAIVLNILLNGVSGQPAGPDTAES
jgi:NCS2 family nucleobase:cation symporter-2